jgi:hypothetical protein
LEANKAARWWWIGADEVDTKRNLGLWLSQISPAILIRGGVSATPASTNVNMLKATAATP